MTKKPLSWTVQFTVDPIWVADGFNVSHDSAKTMLRWGLRGATDLEISARVIHAPSPLIVAGVMGFTQTGHLRDDVIKDLIDGTGPNTVYDALMQARWLIDSVAFVKEEGDKEDVLKIVDEALRLLVGPKLIIPG